MMAANFKEMLSHFQPLYRLTNSDTLALKIQQPKYLPKFCFLIFTKS